MFCVLVWVLGEVVLFFFFVLVEVMLGIGCGYRVILCSYYEEEVDSIVKVMVIEMCFGEEDF